MSQEQDQEKLLNAASQIMQNSVSTTLNLASLRIPKTKIVVKSVRDDLDNARSALKQGSNLERVKQSLAESSVAQKIGKTGGNTKAYVDLIVRKADVDNRMEREESLNLIQQKSRTRKR